MKLIIAGSRSITDYQTVDTAVQLWCEWACATPTEIVSGTANGVDTLGEQWAKTNGIIIKRMPAVWFDRDGIKDPRAGKARNSAMARYVGKEGALLAVWDGESSGTRHMINAARARGLKVFVHKLKDDEL